MILKLPEGYGKTVEAAAQTAKEFLEKLLGPAAEEAGLILGDKIRYQRFQREIKILNGAKQLLQEKGIEPTLVSLKLLAPILDSGSLEEDDSMASRWSALLATAADPNHKSDVLPSFPDILKQLSPLEAKILDLIFDMINQLGISKAEWPSRGAMGKSVRDLLSLQEQDFEIAIDNLYRLRLCSPPSTTLDFIDNKEHRFQLSTKELICITELGFSFVSACKISIGAKTSLQEETSENATKLAKGATGMRFRGEYDPNLTYDFLDMVVRTQGLNAGTYIYINSVPSAGNDPHLGGCWVQLPAGPAVWG